MQQLVHLVCDHDEAVIAAELKTLPYATIDVGDLVGFDYRIYTETAISSERFRPRWYLNGVRDADVTGFIYPADKLKFGDELTLRIVDAGI